MRSRRSGSLGILGLTAGAALVLGACGGSSNPASSSTTSPTTPTSAGAGGTQNAAFTTCLKDHGVTLPAGGFRPPGGGQGTPGSRPARSAAQQSAFAACRAKPPSGGGVRRGGDTATVTADPSGLRGHREATPTA